MLEVRQLSVNYRGVQALDNVDLTLGAGELVGLIGPNGAGKSTLIKAILGLIPSQGGQVVWQGRELRTQRQQVAYVPQRSQIDWDYPITVKTVVLLGCGAQNGWLRPFSRRSHQQAQAALEQVGIWSLRDRPIGELSGGQQQRVFLARALAQDASLLLLDEPFAGIDQATEAVFVRILADLRAAGKAVLVCSHEWGDSLHRYDRLLLLNRWVLADDIPQRVMTYDNIQRAYGQTSPSSFPQGPEMPLAC